MNEGRVSYPSSLALVVGISPSGSLKNGRVKDIDENTSTD